MNTETRLQNYKTVEVFYFGDVSTKELSYGDIITLAPLNTTVDVGSIVYFLAYPPRPYGNLGVVRKIEGRIFHIECLDWEAVAGNFKVDFGDVLGQAVEVRKSSWSENGPTTLEEEIEF